MDREKEFEEMVKAQKCAARKDWEGLKAFFKKQGNEAKLVEPFDLVENTAIHAVARSSGDAQLLEELLEMIPNHQKGVVLTTENKEGNTVLHETVFRYKETDLEKVRVIMDFAKKHHQSGGGPESLFQLKNGKKETPVFRAAKYGNLKMLQYIHDNHCSLQRSEHFPPCETAGGMRRPILHSCLLRHHFDVALWLVEKVDKELIDEPYWVKMKEMKQVDAAVYSRFNCFQLLSKMPMAFGSTNTQEMGITKKILYELLPEKGYESELGWEAGNNWPKSKRDIENVQPDDDTQKPPNKSTFSSLNYAVWKLLVEKVFPSLNYAVWKHLAEKVPSIGKLWHRKKQHMFAKRLVEFIVKRMNTKASWEEYRYNSSDKEPKPFPDFPSNVTEKKKQIELIDRVRKEEKIRREEMEINLELEEKKIKRETPLFLAAASGIIEVVKIIVEKYPEAISHVNEDGLNILHMAIKHRQEKIYKFLKSSSAFKSLTPRISDDGRTILHRAASMEYYRELPLPGVAYQLKYELQWFHEAQSQVPKQYFMHGDENGLTAGDLLDIEHAEMHDQAKVWMKETAQSCSTVAVLIASVVFAAAYALPGGTEKGRPVLHQTTAFKIFTIMDVVALAGSLGSVVMFLSILTSSFDLWDFHVSLPRKLKVGFMMLFFSLITTMMAFTSTIVLTIRMEGNKKTTTFIYSLAFLLVSLFGLTQFPLYDVLHDMLMACVEIWQWVFPSGEKDDLLD